MNFLTLCFVNVVELYIALLEWLAHESVPFLTFVLSFQNQYFFIHE
jgi:hypothetical protein